jgi:drug/metabolite transporter (DMT)-like permease
MSTARIAVLTSLSMIAFAGNSLLCRAALKQANIDAGSFTVIRLFSGAAVLGLIIVLSRPTHSGKGNWLSAFALFVYAAGFSFAYLSLPAATGALLLFGAVQTTMIGHGLWVGERLQWLQITGLLLALGGLLGLLLPNVSAPSPLASMLMLSAGIAWGIYSLRGKGAKDPIGITAGNFFRTLPIAIILGLLMRHRLSLNGPGLGYAIASGALSSGIGYALWYTALPMLKATHAATVQLSVPIIAALGGVLFLGEPLTQRLVIGSMCVLGGIALVIIKKPKMLKREML